MEITIARVDPERLLSYRWHPYAIESGVYYANEPTTLVGFRLADAVGGTQFSVVESGFDSIPLSLLRRFIRLSEVTSVVVFPSSDQAAAITRAALCSDGGVLQSLL